MPPCRLCQDSVVALRADTPLPGTTPCGGAARLPALLRGKAGEERDGRPPGRIGGRPSFRAWDGHARVWGRSSSRSWWTTARVHSTRPLTPVSTRLLMRLHDHEHCRSCLSCARLCEVRPGMRQCPAHHPPGIPADAARQTRVARRRYEAHAADRGTPPPQESRRAAVLTQQEKRAAPAHLTRDGTAPLSGLSRAAERTAPEFPPRQPQTAQDPIRAQTRQCPRRTSDGGI